MHKVVIKISQGSVVTQTTLGGLTIYPPVANLLQCICVKNYENWLRVDKCYCNENRVQFYLANPVYPTGIKKDRSYVLTTEMHGLEEQLNYKKIVTTQVHLENDAHSHTFLYPTDHMQNSF